MSVPIHPIVDGGIFPCMTENFDLLLTLKESQGITKVITLHPLGTINISSTTQTTVNIAG